MIASRGPIYMQPIPLYPYPPGFHGAEFMYEEEDRDVVVFGLETLVVSITDKGMKDINAAFGTEWVQKNIAVRVMRSQKAITGRELHESPTAMNEIIRYHRDRATYDLAREIVERIEPRPWGHSQHQTKEGTTP